MCKTILFLLLVATQGNHVSYMGVECLPEKGTIRLFLKMSHDDFVYDYRYTINDDENFDPSGEIDTTRIFVSRYIADRVQIFADGKKLQGRLINIEPAGGELNMNIIYSYNKNVKHFRIRNTILDNLNKKQSTLLIFKYNDFEEGVTLTPENKEHTFTVR